MQTVYVIDAVRTPIGKYGGALSTIRPDDMLALVIKTLVKRNSSIDTNAIEDVIAGAANQSGEDNRNIARMAASWQVCRFPWVEIPSTGYVHPDCRQLWMPRGPSCAVRGIFISPVGWRV